MTSAARIGNESSALQRAFNFVDRYRNYMGAEPTTIVLFAEDFDSIRQRPQALQRYRLERGPSVEEYR